MDKNKILISHSSTALLMPKMLTGREPTLILTYRLYDGLDGGRRGRLDSFFEKFRKGYRKDGFYIPSNIAELSDILQAVS